MYGIYVHMNVHLHKCIYFNARGNVGKLHHWIWKSYIYIYIHRLYLNEAIYLYICRRYTI